jgi:hypothetical protein
MDILAIRSVNVLSFVKTTLLKLQLLAHQVHVVQMQFVVNKMALVLVHAQQITLETLMKAVGLNVF